MSTRSPKRPRAKRAGAGRSGTAGSGAAASGAEGEEQPRVPQQGRGLRRVEEILDAAERVVMEVGWDAASTQAIAARAGASMGSFFHFFPSKDALLVALARRYTTRMFEANARAMPPEAVFLEPQLFFDRVIGAQAALKHESPVFARIHEALHRRFGPDAGPMCELDEAIYEQVRSFCAARLPRLKGARKEATVRLMVGVVHLVMEMSGQVSPDVARELLGVARDMLAGHLAEGDRRYGSTRGV